MSDHEYIPKSKVGKWFNDRLPLLTLANHLTDYPTPKNLNYWWTFGGILTFCLITQIVTGLVLAMHYIAHADMAFDSVEHIMRDVNYGWLIRYIHANGASMFFLAVYIHIFRSLFYGSYKAPREIIWIIGIVIYLLMMAAAFMGYVLPWGQMSFWGATVITNLFSAIPLVGDSITTWLWGAYSVDNPTLTRFFSLHYLIPFLNHLPLMQVFASQLILIVSLIIAELRLEMIYLIDLQVSYVTFRQRSLASFLT